MPVNNEYKRYFIILQEDEKGYELAAGKVPTGYVKIEMKNGKAKLTAFLQNVRTDDGNDYKILLVAPAHKTAVDLGRFNVDNAGRGEFNTEFESDNVLGSHLGLSEYVVAAVSGKNGLPLSGYVGRERSDWKGKYQIVNVPYKKQVEEIVAPTAPIMTTPKTAPPIEAPKPVAKPIEKPKEKHIEVIKEPVKKVEVPVVVKPKEPVKVIEVPVVVKPKEPVKEIEVPVVVKPQKQEEAVHIVIEGSLEEVVQEVTQKVEIEEPECYVEVPECCVEIPECSSEDSDEHCEHHEHHEHHPEHHASYEISKMPCQKHPYFNSYMYQKLEKVIRRLHHCEPFHNKELGDAWFRVSDDLYLLNSVAIPFMGYMMPLSYPYISENYYMMGWKDYILGIEYDEEERCEEESTIRYIFFGIPGRYNKNDAMFYYSKGYTCYKPHKEKGYGYWIMCVDLRTGKIKK